MFKALGNGSNIRKRILTKSEPNTAWWRGLKNS
jgi:hypothetical protein